MSLVQARRNLAALSVAQPVSSTQRRTRPTGSPEQTRRWWKLNQRKKYSTSSIRSASLKARKKWPCWRKASRIMKNCEKCIEKTQLQKSLFAIAPISSNDWTSLARMQASSTSKSVSTFFDSKFVQILLRSFLWSSHRKQRLQYPLARVLGAHGSSAEHSRIERRMGPQMDCKIFSSFFHHAVLEISWKSNSKRTCDELQGVVQKCPSSKMHNRAATTRSQHRGLTPSWLRSLFNKFTQALCRDINDKGGLETRKRRKIIDDEHG